jgi:arylsulfatase A-like enzyme
MFADDQAQNCTGYAGNSVIQTPNLDRLAADGVYFENAFVTTAICCSSRAGILTGQHMSRHGIRDFQEPLSAEAFAQTYPAILRKAGYRTGYLGKFAVGWPREEIRHLSLPAQEFDYWYGFPQVFNFKQMVDGQAHYLTDLITQKAIEFLQTNPAGQPFCLTVSFKEPHGPHTYFDPDFPELYKTVTIPRPKTLTREAYDAVPDFIKSSLNGSGKQSRFLKDPATYQRHVRTIYSLISRMDLGVGLIMAGLRTLGLADNTVVIWASDHGSFLGAHGLVGKWLMHEESIRIPLIIRDPRQPKRLRGARPRQTALSIDLAPTMLDLAGVRIPDRMQGTSLCGVVAGSGETLREDWYYEHTYEHRGRIRPSEGVRSAEWKYIRYPKQTPPVEQLFHLADDPHEERDLASDARYAATLARLRSRCDQLSQEAG